MGIKIYTRIAYLYCDKSVFRSFPVLRSIHLDSVGV